jgi:hypothetical protein
MESCLSCSPEGRLSRSRLMAKIFSIGSTGRLKLERSGFPALGLLNFSSLEFSGSPTLEISGGAAFESPDSPTFEVSGSPDFAISGDPQLKLSAFSTFGISGSGAFAISDEISDFPTFETSDSKGRNSAALLSSNFFASSRL